MRLDGCRFLFFACCSGLRQTLPDFLVSTRETHSLATCIVERQDLDTFEMFHLAS